MPQGWANLWKKKSCDNSNDLRQHTIQETATGSNLEFIVLSACHTRCNICVSRGAYSLQTYSIAKKKKNHSAANWKNIFFWTDVSWKTQPGVFFYFFGQEVAQLAQSKNIFMINSQNARHSFCKWALEMKHSFAIKKATLRFIF